MEIRYWQQLSSSRREPCFFGTRLALRAVPVAARMVQVAQHTAVIAALDMTTQRGSAAGDNSSPCLVPDNGQGVCVEIGLAVFAQNVSQAHIVGHERC